MFFGGGTQVADRHRPLGIIPCNPIIASGVMSFPTPLGLAPRFTPFQDWADSFGNNAVAVTSSRSIVPTRTVAPSITAVIWLRPHLRYAGRGIRILRLKDDGFKRTKSAAHSLLGIVYARIPESLTWRITLWPIVNEKRSILTVVSKCFG